MHRCYRKSHSANLSESGVCTQAGLTLVELMISMTVGLIVVMAATSLLISTKSGYLVQDDEVHMQDTARYAIEVISRAIRQSSFENWDVAEVPLVVGPRVSGLDARRLTSRTDGMTVPEARSINGSDVLAVRFSGSGTGDHGDGTMTNCAGFGVAAAVSGQSIDEGQGWSIFYVGQDSTGENELYCKYRGANGWSSQAIARGVETFQVLYGVDTDLDGLPNQYLTATAIDTLSDAFVQSQLDHTNSVSEGGANSDWNKVVSVKFALLLRGSHRLSDGDSMGVYDLFGSDYAEAHGDSDPGVRIMESVLPKSARGKRRRIFSTTIQLRPLLKEDPK